MKETENMTTNPNNRISPKKLFAMLSIELFAMTSLILPAVLVGFAGKNGLPVLLAASGLLLLQTVWYLWCLKEKNKSPDQIVEEEMDGLAKMLIKAIYSIRYFIHGLFLMIIFVNLIQEVLLPDMNLFLILLPVLMLLFMTGGRQLRVRGRILEVLFPYIFIPLLVVLLSALFQLDYASLPEQLWTNARMAALDFTYFAEASSQNSGHSMLYSIYGILLFYQPIEFLLFLQPSLQLQKNQRAAHTAGFACIFVIIINIMMVVAAVGMFGTVRTGEKLWSALYIMQSVRLPGKFVERLDILFLVFWIFSAFALVSAYLYYGKRFWAPEFLCCCQKSETNQINGWYSILWLAALLLLTLLIREPEAMFHFFIPYKMWIDFPLAILLPTYFYLKKHRTKLKKSLKTERKHLKTVVFVLILAFSTICMTGCQDRVDIEDKNYVMTLSMEPGQQKQWKITYEIADLSQSNQDGKAHAAKTLSYEADSLSEAEEMDKSMSDKKLDYGHLKAILFSTQLMEQEDDRNKIIQEMKDKTSIAGTTLLFFTENEASVLLEAGEKQASSLGEYLENVMANHKADIEQEDTLARFLRDESENVVGRTIYLLQLKNEKIEFKTGKLDDSELTTLAQTILRFHIRANSDSESDQQLKVAVKDRILPNLQELLSDCISKGECMTKITESICLIEEWVQEACTEEQYECESNVYLCRESFPLKTYGDMVFPSGVYDALRIDLGEAEGANWWCMMYPSLCLSDGVIEGVSDEAKEELEECLEKEEYEALFYEENHKFHFKWRIGEFLSNLFQ